MLAGPSGNGRRYFGSAHRQWGIARLKRENLVTSAPYRSVFLTPKGKRLADRARQRHQLVVEFLLALKVPRRDAEADAEGIEHHLSPRTLQAIRRFLHNGR